MDPTVPLLILLAILLFIVVPVLAISAFISVRNLRSTVEHIPQIVNRLYRVEQKLEQLEQVPVKPTGVPATPKAEAWIPHPPIPSAPVTGLTPPAEPSRTPPPPIPLRPAAEGVPLAPRKIEPTVAETEEPGVEAMIAGRWLNYVGILALFLAILFFLKYAFDNNWVGPRGRVGIGLLIGSALFPFSHRLLDRGYKLFSEGIAGLGAAVLYLSLWAGWHYYQLFPQWAAFALMILVTAATAAVSVGRNSERIALLTLAGGVITPMLVSTGRDQEVVLFTYLIVIGAGMLALARTRDWKTLAPVQFVATLIYFWGWYDSFYKDAALGRTILFATLFFLLFAALPVARSWREGELSALESVIVLVNSFAYLIALRMLLWPHYRWGLTLTVLALAAVHLGFERALPKKAGKGKQIARALFAGLALTFVTLAVPIRLDGRWITIGWAVEGAVLAWSGLRIRVAALRGAAFLLFVVVALRLVFIPIEAHQFVLNARFATFAAGVASFLLACYFARTAGLELGATEKGAFAATAIVASIGALAALSLEIWDAVGRMPSFGIDRDLAQQLALSSLWLVYALGLIVAGIVRKSASLRWQALGLLGVVIGKVFLFDLSFLDRFYRIVSFLLLGLVLMVISFFYQKRMGAKKKP